MRVLVATAAVEGGNWTLRKDRTAPIRLYSDRWIEDDIAAMYTGQVKRQRLSKNEFNRHKTWAKANT